MGEKQITQVLDDAVTRDFTLAILEDIRALERMVDEGLVETGARRVGAEQEMFLVDAHGFAAPIALEIMKRLAGDARFQTEVALFNLEANLGVQDLDGAFLQDLENELGDVLGAARGAAGDIDSDVVLTGILPTLRREDVTLRNLTPEGRYERLNVASLAAQDGSISIMVDGLDRFEERFESVVIEGANTSLQLHLQVGPEEAARLYNLAQLITAPLLAAASNSPVLLGKRVWQETRVAVFERVFDDRSTSQLTRGVPTRVGFGSFWLKDSLLELFHDNIARYQIIMTREDVQDPNAALERGEAPLLQALTLHNSTVWRWNRPCYGITGGKPHLRIENRVLPSGPTVLDEVANAALFYGLMMRLDESCGDVSRRLSFRQAKENFIACAHYGLSARVNWLDGQRVTARELLLSELIPEARVGLAGIGVPDEDIHRYLDVVQARVESGQTGSSWLLEGLSQVPPRGRPDVCQNAVQVIRQMEQGEQPVHRWEPLVPKPGSHSEGVPTLGSIMSTDVFTVRPGDLVDLATSMMEWKHIRHVPVEDADGRLVGMLSSRDIMHVNDKLQQSGSAIAVKDLMNTAPLTAPETMTVIDGMQHMLQAGVGYITVVRDHHLIGIVTEHDLVRVASELLRSSLRSGAKAEG